MVHKRRRKSHLCWFPRDNFMRNRFVWWFCIDIACATFFRKVIHGKVETNWNLVWKKNGVFFENFENLEIFRIFEISIFNRIFNENQNLEISEIFRNFQKISIFSVQISIRPNFFENCFEKKCRTWYIDAKSSYKSIAHT